MDPEDIVTDYSTIQESCVIAKIARYISGLNERLRRYGHLRILGDMEPHFGEGKVVGVNDGTIRKSDGGFL